MSETDMHQRLAELVDARPLDVEGRLRSLQNGRRPSGQKRALTVIVALAVALASAVFVARAFVRSEGGTVPAAPSTPEGQIAFTRAQDETDQNPTYVSDIYIVNADGTGLAPLVDGPTIETYPTWSPDGTRLAFTRAEPGSGGYGLYVTNADGTGLTRLATGTSTIALAWSPDGARIAFVVREQEGENQGLYVMNADGSDRTAVLKGNWEQVAWSPDGQTFLLSGFPIDASNTGHYDIYSVGVDGTGLTQLTDDEANNQWPTWSPDGTRIAFMHDETATDYRWDVYVMNTDGTGRTQLTDWRGFDGTPTWSPDAEWIAFGSDRVATDAQLEQNSKGGNGVVGVAVWIMRADGTDARQVTPSDGDWIAFPSSWRAATG